MKISDLTMPEIEIYLEGNNHFDCDGMEEIVNNHYMIGFDVRIDVTYNYCPGDEWTPGDTELNKVSIEVTNAKYGPRYDDCFDITDSESEQLAKKIKKSITII